MTRASRIWAIVALSALAVFSATIIIAQVTHQDIDNRVDALVREQGVQNAQAQVTSQKVNDIDTRLSKLEFKDDGMAERLARVQAIMEENQLWLHAVIGGIVLLIAERIVARFSKKPEKAG